MKKFLIYVSALIITGVEEYAVADFNGKPIIKMESGLTCFTECGRELNLFLQTGFIVAHIVTGSRIDESKVLAQCVLYGLPGKSDIFITPGERETAETHTVEVEDDLIFDDIVTTTSFSEIKRTGIAVEPQALYTRLLREKPAFDKVVEAYVEQGICNTVTDISVSYEESD